MNQGGASPGSTRRKEAQAGVNYEFGVKHAGFNGRAIAEVVGFYNDYSNITGTCTASTGCSNAQLDAQFNGGAAAIRGVEARLAYTASLGAVDVPLQLNATFLNAEFRNDFQSGSAEWGSGAVRNGDPLPYVPQVQYTFTAGTRYKVHGRDGVYLSRRKRRSKRARKPPSHPRLRYRRLTVAIRLRKPMSSPVDNLLGRITPSPSRRSGPGLENLSFMVGLTHQF